MTRTIITGIDIGTYAIKVVIADARERNERGLPRILGTGIAESAGLRHGYVIDPIETSERLKIALAQAEEKAGVKVKRAFVGVNGVGLSSIMVSSSIVTSRADAEITRLDIDKVNQQAEQDIPPASIANRQIIYDIPIQYSIDGSPVLGEPEGMKGNKLDLRILFITCTEQHVSNLITAVNDAGIEVEDVMAAPLSGGFVTLTKAQKIAGCALLNIGAETSSITVFENNLPLSLEVFEIGSNDITNDIALGLKVSLEEAEQIKVGALTGSAFSRKKLDEIINARISDILDLAEAHLKRIGRNGLLPAGIVVTGGGAGLPAIEAIIKTALKLPTRIGTFLSGSNAGTTTKDATWTIAYGLCIWGQYSEEGPDVNALNKFWKNIGRTIAQYLKKILP